MAILNIVKTGDPILHKTSRPVEEITPRILLLIDDMKETLADAGGVGLAAPQVGVLRRVILVENAEGEILELINPRITVRSKERQHELEGCLSVPDRWGITDRPMSVTVTAQDRTGKEVTYTGSGLTARCFCHEIDHLDGILFTDHARMLSDEEMRELEKKS